MGRFRSTSGGSGTPATRDGNPLRLGARGSSGRPPATRRAAGRGGGAPGPPGDRPRVGRTATPGRERTRLAREGSPHVLEGLPPAKRAQLRLMGRHVAHHLAGVRPGILAQRPADGLAGEELRRGQRRREAAYRRSKSVLPLRAIWQRMALRRFQRLRERLQARMALPRGRGWRRSSSPRRWMAIASTTSHQAPVVIISSYIGRVSRVWKAWKRLIPASSRAA